MYMLIIFNNKSDSGIIDIILFVELYQRIKPNRILNPFFSMNNLLISRALHFLFINFTSLH